jgi:hypothetical protein
VDPLAQPVELSRVARIDMLLNAKVTLPDRTVRQPAAVDVAVLRAGAWPTADTDWRPVSAEPPWVILACPDADQTDAVPLPVGTSDVWGRATEQGLVVVALMRRFAVH